MIIVEIKLVIKNLIKNTIEIKKILIKNFDEKIKKNKESNFYIQKLTIIFC